MAVASSKQLSVHLAPGLVEPDALRGGVAVVLDVLRATTTIVHALAAGCVAVRPVLEVEDARRLADQFQPSKLLLGGERGGKRIDGFDLGNSPSEFNPERCRDALLLMTTTNGTRAILHAAPAERVLVAGFVNFSATCAELASETRPLHLLCAGADGRIALEDALLAGAMVEALRRESNPAPRRGLHLPPDQSSLLLDDGARMAWDCFEHHGLVLEEALRLSASGQRLIELGYDEDVKAAAQVDRFFLTVELCREPLALRTGRVGITRPRWPN